MADLVMTGSALLVICTLILLLILRISSRAFVMPWLSAEKLFTVRRKL